MKTWEIYKFGNLSISVVLEGNSTWTIEMLKHQVHPFVEYIASFLPFFQILYGNEKELKLNFSNQNELIEYSIKLAEKETELNNVVKDILGDIAKKIEIETYNNSCLQLQQENDELYLERNVLNTANSGLNSVLEMKEQELNRYRKALEEIETVTKINCEEICGRKFTDCKDTSCFSVNILNIIN